MAVTAGILTLTLRWTWLGQQMQTMRYFEPVGAAFLNVEPIHVAEAYWNHVKTVWRAIVPVGYTAVFSSVLVEELGGNMGFAEYSVPTEERGGTRSGTLGDALPSFMAGGIRFTVGTRATRPGQMRVPFLMEVDSANNELQTAFRSNLNILGGLYTDPMVLGAPVATGVLNHLVVRKQATAPYAILASQPVTGFLVNTNVTTQNSRKVGRGS